MTDLALGFGLAFDDLYDDAGLARVDGAFCDHLKGADAELYNRLMAGRADPTALADKDASQLLIDLGPHLEDFIGRLFGIEKDVAALAARHDALAPVYRVKRLFVQRRAVRKYKPEEAEALDGPTLEVRLTKTIGPLTEESFARAVEGWLADEAANGDPLALAEDFAAWATLSAMGRKRFASGVLFKTPRKLDMMHLVPVETEVKDGVRMIRLDPHHALRHREGFALTDPGTDLNHALDQANYCIWCHNQGKDSCSKGLKDRKTGAFQKSTFGVTLAGLPARGEDLRAPLAQGRGPLDRAASPWSPSTTRWSPAPGTASATTA